MVDSINCSCSYITVCSGNIQFSCAKEKQGQEFISQIDVQQRRFDLIPNLLETVSMRLKPCRVNEARSKYAYRESSGSY